jgi:hypothetical protein
MYQTSLGFFDLAVATPSMKAALEACGTDSNLFRQGTARQNEDPDVIEATMAAPGVVLKRAVGPRGPFREHAKLPTDLAAGEIGAWNLSARSRQVPINSTSRKTFRS